MTIAERHRCRNPHCKSKLPAPTDNEHKAFCTPGCYRSFYLRRCIVCENEKPADSNASRKFCRRPKCRSDYRRNGGLYAFLGTDSACAPRGPKTSIKSGIETGPRDDRTWRIAAAGTAITATAFHFATLPLDLDTARRTAAGNDWDRIRRETAWGRL
jgi:hypothetical protein